MNKVGDEMSVDDQTLSRALEAAAHYRRVLAAGESASEDRVAASRTGGSPPDDPRPRPSYGTACAVMAAGVAAVATIDS
jgi:hypothetical protein